MLTNKISWLWLALASVTIIFVAYLAALHFGAVNGGDEICKDYPYPHAKDCTRFDRALVFTWQIGKALNRWAPAVAAIAAIAVAAFTLTLKWSTDKQVALGNKSIELARDEFEAAHRPWIAIDGDPSVPQAAIHIDETKIETTLEYNLKNTVTVPALDVVCVSSIVPASIAPEAFGKIVKANRAQYEEGSEADRHETQNQVIFPNEKSPYKINVPLTWRVPSTGTARSAADISSLLVISAFFYVDGYERRRQMFTACVHEIRAGITQQDLEAAENGTGVLKDGKINKWSTGWSAA